MPIKFISHIQCEHTKKKYRTHITKRYNEVGKWSLAKQSNWNEQIDALISYNKEVGAKKSISTTCT